jgi:hypothetical protein
MVLLPKQVHLQKDVGAGRVGLEGRRGRGESRDGLAGSERQADEGQEEGDEQGEVGVQSGHGWLAGWLAGWRVVSQSVYRIDVALGGAQAWASLVAGAK